MFHPEALCASQEVTNRNGMWRCVNMSATSSIDPTHDYWHIKKSRIKPFHPRHQLGFGQSL